MARNPASSNAGQHREPVSKARSEYESLSEKRGKDIDVRIVRRVYLFRDMSASDSAPRQQSGHKKRRQQQLWLRHKPGHFSSEDIASHGSEARVTVRARVRH